MMERRGAVTTIYADELQMGDVVDYLGTPHRVAHVDRHAGWAWPVAYDDRGWAIALGHQPVMIVTRPA
jgi:hypothetical protein